MKKFILLLLIITLVAGGAILLKKRKQSIKESPTPTPPAFQVKVVSAKTAELRQTRSVLALLSARESAEISSKLSGKIEEIFVKENQTVKKGTPLLRIDNREITANIRSLQASLSAQTKDVDYAQNLHKRNKALFEVGGLAREKFEASEVALATKQASLEATQQKIAGLKVQLSYLSIAAPFSGTIGTIFAHVGDLALPGKPILSLNSPDQKLTFNYVPVDISVKTGQLAFLDGQNIGQITNLYSDAVNGLSVAEIVVDSPLPQPNNSYLTIDLLTFESSGCTVPLNTLEKTKKTTQVMMYTDGIFKPLPITIIAENNDHALIEPCPESPIAVATAAKLGMLPGYNNISINKGDANE